MTETPLKASPESVTYIIMLAAFQVVLNCQLELEGTVYDQGKIKQKVREAINMMNIKNTKNHKAIWKVDPEKAADMMYAIELIGKQIAQGDGTSLSAITLLTRKGFNLAACKITELSEDEIKNLESN